MTGQVWASAVLTALGAVRVDPGTALWVFRGRQVTHLDFFLFLFSIHGSFSFRWFIVRLHVCLHTLQKENAR